MYKVNVEDHLLLRCETRTRGHGYKLTKQVCCLEVNKQFLWLEGHKNMENFATKHGLCIQFKHLKKSIAGSSWLTNLAPTSHCIQRFHPRKVVGIENLKINY
ncbi:hypothetical protein ElyMa_005431700 [Elysia marginata]|uniref:Uncharacterized protein n=1 Tax=Elysia marginata TaxID=1093978 RepID=A0AAV4EL82_9GAST|nr:hypothetical protein ElyMa_005431700 [Elysia marginata]